MQHTHTFFCDFIIIAYKISRAFFKFILAAHFMFMAAHLPGIIRCTYHYSSPSVSTGNWHTLINTQRMIHTTLKQKNAVLSSGRKVLWPDHQLSLRRRNVYRLYLFQTLILSPFWRSWPVDQHLVESPWQSTAVLPYKGDFPGLFAAAYSNKAYAQSDTTLRSQVVRPA